MDSIKQFSHGAVFTGSECVGLRVVATRAAVWTTLGVDNRTKSRPIRDRIVVKSSQIDDLATVGRIDGCCFFRF